MSNQSQLPATGLLRLRQILSPEGPIPVSKSTWWAGVKDGRFPKPLKLGARVTVWRVEDIRELIENGAEAQLARIQHSSQLFRRSGLPNPGGGQGND